MLSLRGDVEPVSLDDQMCHWGRILGVTLTSRKRTRDYENAELAAEMHKLRQSPL